MCFFLCSKFNKNSFHVFVEDMSDHCELCLNPISTRVFPCLYHCKKRLCIQHLMEHEKSIEKQINDQKQLEILWKDYSLNFNEKKMFEEFIQLKTKLFNYQKLKEEINQLLGIHHFEDSIDNSQKFEKAIQTIQKAMDEEQQSTIDTIHPKIEPLINEESDTDFGIFIDLIYKNFHLFFSSVFVEYHRRG